MIFLIFKVVQYIENFFELLCTAFEGEAFCRGIFNEYANHFVKNLFKKVFSPKDFCGYIGFCKDSYRKLDINDYMKDVLADKPNFTAPQPTMKNKLKVLHLSDLHIDFEYEEVSYFFIQYFFSIIKKGKNAYCDQSFCCRGENGDPTSPEQGAQYWGTMAVCDIPPVIKTNYK